MAPRIESSDESDSDVPLGALNGAPKKPPSNGAVPTNVNGKRTLSPSATTNGASRAAAKRSRTTSERSISTKNSSSSARSSTTATPKQRPPKRKPVPEDSELSSEEETPLSQSNPAKQVVALAILPPTSNGPVVAENVPTAGAGASTQVKNEDGDEMDVDSDDDKPLKKKAAPRKSRASTAKKAKVEDPDVKMESGDDDSDAPIKKKRAAPRKSAGKKGKAKKEEPEPESQDEDHTFSAPSTSKDKKPRAPPKRKAKVEAKSEDGEAGPTSPSKRKTKKEEEEEEEKYRWWEAEAQGDGSQKWTTLEHGGVFFPPPYEPLPSTVKLIYDGKPLTLPAESEEVAGFFGAMLETDHAKDAKFCENFFKDFTSICAKHPPKDGTVIDDFEKCDFTRIYEHFESERAKKKTLSAAEKKEAKAKKEEIEASYLYCTLDGRKEKVGNFRAEPPGLFRGRGDHPKKGALKLRLHPEDITINIGDNAPIPKPNAPGKWGKIIHDNTVTWLAHWKENINGNSKYVFLAAGSSLKGQSDMQKFEKARELKKHIAKVRADYNVNLVSKVTAERQMATALYFIDRLALRAGNEKGEEEADTVGCCSLRYEHVTLQPPNQLVFDFLGKDSIRYYNVVDVEPQIYKNIRIFKGDPKTEGDDIFDRVTTSGINKHLTSYMKGLTAKVFRTYNASITFQQQLDEKTPKDGTLLEKLAAYNEANRMVAILCNHQKSVSKTHGASMDKIENQIRASKYQRRKLRYALFTMNKKYKKQSDLAEDESDVDDEWIAQYEDESREKEIEKAKKKHEKDNEKRAADGEKPLGDEALDEKIEKINEEYDRLKGERGNKNVEVKGKKTEEGLLEAIKKIDAKIKNEQFKRDDKEKLKEVALGTSKINYLDPRITTAWCKTHNVPVEKMFNKSLIVKFPWAMEVDKEWKF